MLLQPTHHNLEEMVIMRGPYLYAEPHRLLNPASKQFAEDPRNHLAHRSMQRYATTWRLLQRRHPDFRIEEFTAEVLADFITTNEDGTRRQVGTPGNRETSINSQISALRKIFVWAKKSGLIKEDPTEDLREYGYEPRTHRRHIWLRKDQLKALLEAPGEDALGLRDRTLLQTFLGTGLRKFELAALTWGDMDLEAVTVHVNHGKGDKYRPVPLTAKTVESLTLWRTVSERALGRPVAATDPLFPRGHAFFSRQPVAGEAGHNTRDLVWDGKPLRLAGVLDVVSRNGAAIGIPQLRPHDLRRTYAGLLEESGTPVQQISKLLGHESVDTTIKYLADSPAKRAAAVAGADW